MSDEQPQTCRNCNGLRIAGMEICRECWEQYRAEALRAEPKLDEAKDERETGEMFS